MNPSRGFNAGPRSVRSLPQISAICGKVENLRGLAFKHETTIKHYFENPTNYAPIEEVQTTYILAGRVKSDVLAT